MPLPRLIVRQAPAAKGQVGVRADVALFVGLTPRRPGAVPDALRAWLEAAGWAGQGACARSDAQVAALLDVPVPVESWSDFDALFAWDERSVEAGSALSVPCPLGLAVRSFFLEGGARAYVVRTGDPPPLIDRADPAQVLAARRRLISWDTDKSPPKLAPPDAAQRVPLLPGFGGLGRSVSAGDAKTWSGAALAFALDDVALMALPDLPELFAASPQPVAGQAAPPPVPEQFKPCAPVAPTAAPPPRHDRLELAAPRLDRVGYKAWAGALQHTLKMLSPAGGAGHRRDVMLVASLPLPSHEADAAPARAEAWPLSVLDEEGLPAAKQRLLDAQWLGSARLQLAYPWVATEASDVLPEGLQAPEGVLLGAIARTTLSRGAFRSAAGAPLASIRAVTPELGSSDLARGLADGRADWLGDRLSLLGTKVGRWSVLSDATASSDVQWRAGGVSRLINLILRAARWLGAARLFEPSGPALWAELKTELEAYLDRLWAAGALAGASAAEAYTVTCDRSTMTQSDIDTGRVVAAIAFTAAQPIQRITISLALSEAGGAAIAEAA